MEGVEESYAVAKEPDEQKYLKFEAWEYDLMTLLDGTRDLDAVAEAFRAGHPEIGADREFVEAWVEDVRRLGLIERTEQERHLAMMDRLRSSRRRRLWDAERSTLFQILIPLWDPDAMMDRALPWIRWWWSPWFVAAWMAVFAAVLGFLVRHWDVYWAGFFSLLDVTTKTVWDWIGLFVLIFVISVWHELGHGLTCKRFGGEVHSIGIMLFYLQPAFYCGIDDAYLFPRRSHRMYVAFGGSYFELMLCSAAMPAWLWTPPESWIHQVAATTIFFSGLSLLAFNLNPLIKLDGYYVLMDYLDVPNLREESFEHIGGLLKRRILHLSVPDPPLSPRRRRIYLIYGGLSIAYTAAVIALVYVFVERYAVGWFGPAGYLILAAAAAFALRRRIRDAAIFLRHLWLDKREWLLSPSGGATAGMAVAVAALLATLPRSATRIGGAFVVEPAERSVLRAPADAFVRVVAASEGDAVEPGRVLGVLEDPELAAGRAAAAADLAREEREAARARRLGDAVGAAEHEERAREARARRDLLDAKTEALNLRAPIAGVVSTPRLEETEGAHLRAGEVFCAVDRLDAVRLAVTLSEHDVEEVAERLPARVRLAAYPGRTLRSEVRAVAPEARPPDGPRLPAAELVGPSHQVRVLVEMENARGLLRPGMTGRIQILARPRSPAAKLFRRVHRWASSVFW
jgi:putative peptide zinc metalloprotease protein